MNKTLKRLLPALGGLILILLVGAQILLSSSVITRIVSGIAADYVEGEANIGSIRLSVFRNFPNVRIDISDVSVTYPHERFAEYDSVGIRTPLLDAGRGDDADTLAAFDSFSGAVNLIALLRGKYRIQHADLEGFRAFLHCYDSTAANLDIIRMPESSDTTSEPMDLKFGSLRIGGWPEIVYTSQRDTIFAHASFKRLAGKGRLSLEGGRRRGKDLVGLRLDSLFVSGRLPEDTVVAEVNKLDLYEHKDHIDIESSAEFQLFTWALGRLDIPVGFELEIGLPEPVDGIRELDILGLHANIAHVPLAASGLVRLAGDSTYVRADAVVENCRADKIIAIYGSNIIPVLKDFSTDAVLDFTARADGWFGAADGKLPPIKASLKVDDSHFAYDGLFDGGRFDLSLDIENTASGVLNADLEDFCLKIPGADLNLSGTVEDALGKDPLISVNATACTEFADLVKYLPKELGIDAGGDVDFELSGRLRLSQLNLSSITDTDISGRVFSDGLRFSSPADSLYAYAARPEITISTRSGEETGGLDISAALDSIRMSSGATTYIMGQGMRLIAKNSGKIMHEKGKFPTLDADLSISSLNMRGSDSLTLGLRGSQNTFKVSRKGSLPALALGSGNRMIYLRSGSNRIALQNVALSANALKRAVRERPRGVGSPRMRPDSSGRIPARAPRMRPDSLNRRARLPGDSARVRFSRTLPDYLSEVDFRKRDINLQLGDGIVKLLREWQPDGKLSINYGTVATPILPLRNSISDLSGSFTENVIRLNNLNIRSGESSLAARGTASGMRGLLMGRRSSPVRLDMMLDSKMLNANELLAAYSLGSQLSAADLDALDDAAYAENLAIDTLSTAEVQAENYSLLVLPGNISAEVDLNVDSLRYSNISLKDFTSRIQMQERCLQLTNTFADANFGKAAVEGFYSTKTKKDISAGFNLAFEGITSEKVIEIFPKVDSLVPMLKSFKGDLDCEFAATTQLDTNMNILIPTINGVVKLNGTGLELEDTGELRKLAQILMFKDTKVGHIKDMSINGIIANNQLEIFPFILGVDRYTLALKGLQGFDQNFKYHISVIKSPLPFKFGVNLKGNFDNWKYSIGKAQYKSTSIPLFTPVVDTMQVNLVVSIKNIFQRGVDAAIREVYHGRQNVEAMKSELGYEIEDDELLSSEEQDELDSYLIGMELENESMRIEEELEAMLEEELMQSIKTLTEGLNNRKK